VRIALPAVAPSFNFHMVPDVCPVILNCGLQISQKRCSNGGTSFIENYNYNSFNLIILPTFPWSQILYNGISDREAQISWVILSPQQAPSLLLGVAARGSVWLPYTSGMQQRFA
jgi:hypothetical protein